MSDRSPSQQLRRGLLLASLRLPRRVRHRLVGQPLTNDRGVQIDADLWWLLALERVLGKKMAQRSAEDARAGLSDGVRITEGAPRSAVAILDIHLFGRGARIYRPLGSWEDLPVLLYAHGGGWVVGSLRSHDRWCRRLCEEAGVVVVSLDYRLAPENPFPAGLDDMLGAFGELRERSSALSLNPDLIAVGGDSAGGNLAAAACLALRDAGGPMPLAQVLIYPGLDLRCLTETYRRFGHGLLLESASIDWYIAQYAPTSVLDPAASPLLASTHADLPPALVAVAGFDPLRDDGDAYAAALREAGVPVHHLTLDDMTHGFLQLDGAISAAGRASATVTAAVGALLHPENS